MARHAKSVDRRSRTTRLATIVVVWVGGLVAGFFGLLGGAARYGCGSNDHGLACGNSGSVLAVLTVLAVVAVVTTVTVVTHDRTPQRVLAVGVVGLVALFLCFVAARSLLGTV